MKKTIDCLFIGHNEMDFPEYEKTIRKMGVNSGAYRDLNLNFIRYNDRVYTTPEIFNVLSSSCERPNGAFQPLNMGETFSAAVAYLGTYLDRRDLTFDYVNSFQNRKNELAEKLTTFDILTVAITTTYYISVLPMVEIIDFIKQHNSSAKIIIGGPFISTQVRNQDADSIKYLFLSTLGADFYVNSSQGETALVEIIKALKNDLPFENINNIYCNTEKRFISTPTVRETNILSENMVDWNLFSGGVGEYAGVRTSISCPFSCSFCGFPQHAGAYQTANVDAVEEELRTINKIETLKTVHFVDDSFNVPPKRFKEVLKMIIRNKFGFKWHSYFRCQYADEEMVELMKESGCEGVFLGIESGNEQILKNMNKAATVDDYHRGIELLKKNGIVTFGDFIIGFPGETPDTARDTVKFIETGGLDFYRTQLWYCDPITPIWKEKEKYKIKGESFEWSHATMDNKQASDIIEEIFLTPRNATWIPQYNFDYDNIWHLVHRGMSIERVAIFLEAFNNAVREKLKDPNRKEVSFESITQIRNACCETENPGENFDNNTSRENELDAEFDFI